MKPAINYNDEDMNIFKSIYKLYNLLNPRKLEFIDDILDQLIECTQQYLDNIRIREINETISKRNIQ
jgi:hypothetical protein